MPVNNFLYLTDARSAQNTFLYAPTPRANANNFLYTCYGTNGLAAMSDPDAAAYATTAQVLATPERNALNTLVVQLKAAGLWVKMTAIYPMTPSSGPLVDSYKLNLRNIATHELTIPIDVSCGLQGLRNALNTANVCTSSTLNYNVVDVENNAIGVYYRTAVAPTTDTDISISGGGIQTFLITCYTNAIGGLSGEAGYLHYSSGPTANSLSGLASGPGLHVLNRAATVATYYRQSSAIESKTGTTITQPVGGLFTLGSRSLAPISFAFVSTSLTGAEVSALNTIVDTYQAALTVPRNYAPSQLLDTDTNNFYTLAQLPRWRHIEIINDLVTGLKAAALWFLIDALYPFIGGTAYRHSLNLKNPLTYTITWSGSLTHNASGVVGINDAAQGVIGALSRRAYYCGLYVGSNSGPASARDFGDFTDPSEWFGIAYQWSDGVFYVDAQKNLYQSKVGTLTTGYKAVSSQQNLLSLFEGNQSVSTLSHSVVLSSTPQQNITLFRSQNSQATLRTYSVAVLAEALTPAQHSTLYGLIQAYQTSMARQV
jgi:hypothetical protein